LDRSRGRLLFRHRDVLLDSGILGSSDFLLQVSFILRFNLGLLRSETVNLLLMGLLLTVTESFSLIREELGTGSFSLGLMDVFHQDTLILEDVTLALHVEFMVQVLVNLALGTIFTEQATENTLTAHP